MPLIYANEGFERITGHSVAKTLGRNCRFLQGTGGSCVEALDELRAAITQGRACTVQLDNYHKNGDPFVNNLVRWAVPSHG